MDYVVVNCNRDGKQISRDIYGHFSEHLGRCIYGGFWVGKDSKIPNINGYRKDVVEAFKEIDIPNLRWPGGCFADEYHWRDGMGPYETRKKMLTKMSVNVAANLFSVAIAVYNNIIHKKVLQQPVFCANRLNVLLVSIITDYKKNARKIFV